MQKILLKYSGNLSQLDWALYSSDNQLLMHGAEEPLEALMQKIDFKQAKVYFLIATPDVVIKTVEIPGKTAKHNLLKIIPSLLEEDLLSPAEDLHFSAVELEKNKYAVAIMDKLKLQNIISTFQSNQITLEAVAPLFMAIPGEEKHVWFNTRYAFAKINNQFGFCIEKEQFPAFADESDFEIHSGNIWELLANTRYINFNLLKGTSAYRRTYNLNKKLKKHLVIASALMATMLLSLFFIDLYQIRKEENQVKSDIAEIYQKLYPNSANMVNPRQRMEQELKAGLRSGNGHFIELLHFWGNQIQSLASNVHVKQFSYRADKMELMVEADNYTFIDQLVKKLSVKPYKVEQKNTALQEGNAKSVIIISREG